MYVHIHTFYIHVCTKKKTHTFLCALRLGSKGPLVSLLLKELTTSRTSGSFIYKHYILKSTSHESHQIYKNLQIC